MTPTLSLARLRSELGRTWLIALFGIVYVVSQITILVIVEPIGSSLIRLQCLGFSATEYQSVFRHWEATGAMSAYRAHFIFDDVHWLWYSGLFTAGLCRLFEIHRVPARFDWILALPLVSGLLDCLENRLQHVFLNSRDFASIVDPLPLLSTIASDAKWLLASAYLLLAVVLLLRIPASKQSRPRWITALAVFCLATVLFLVSRDLFLPDIRDVEVWLGFELRGAAALATAPVHWAIFLVGAWAFWTRRPWILPCAAGYVFYVSLSHLIWNEVSPNGRGWTMGLAQALAISVPGVLLLRAHRKTTRERVAE